MSDLLQYMAVDVDELTRKTAFSRDNVCCGENELSYLRETTNFVNYTGVPKEPHLAAETLDFTKYRGTPVDEG